MRNLIQELEFVMKEKDLSSENAARYIGCSFKQIYNWLQGTSKPSLIYRKAIRHGIERMKKLASISMENVFKDRDLYRKIKRNITFEEKDWLLDSASNYSIYRERLKELAAKYKI